MTEGHQMAGLLPPIHQIEVRLRAVETVRLPGWIGSTLHGALGGAIRALTCSRECAERHPQEPGCCPYARLFERPTAPEGVPPWLTAMAGPPLTLRPPAPGPASELLAGQELRFGLTVVGARAADDLGYLLAGLERMAQHGLGKGRSRLELLEVASDDVAVWEGGRVAGMPPPAHWSADPLGAVVLRTITPLRIVRNGETVAPRFEDLVAAAARRVLALAAFFGGQIQDIRVDDLARRASKHTMRAYAVWEPFHTRRWSSRQRRSHPTGGYVGEMEIDGPGPFGPWLAATELVGIGKGTSFGFGHFELRPL